MRKNRDIISLYCCKCKGTTRWARDHSSGKYSCIGDERHPERKVAACGTTVDLYKDKK